MDQQAPGVWKWEPLKALDLLLGWVSLAALWRMDLSGTRREQGDQL